MKIAILGTRGIPNNHGGFEQFAEYLSQFLVSQGHQVWVYNSHNHPYTEGTWKGVRIIHKYDPEYAIGTFGQFIYDLNCILDSRKRKFDVILQLGYTSSSIWGWLLPGGPVTITNMDGLEWKRTKYPPLVRKFLKAAERLAVKWSDFHVADSIGIQDYLQREYAIESRYIPYGAIPFTQPDAGVLNTYGVLPFRYNMLIARLEPENNIETILKGVSQMEHSTPFLVIGKHDTKFGNYLKKRFSQRSESRFLGGIYNLSHLNNLRCYSNLYFHGHSAGGTNPSLLEAMASEALIVAHENIFNKSILGEDAFYFKDDKEIKAALLLKKEDFGGMIKNNKAKIADRFSWQKINGQYEKLIKECLEK
jgi:glycosyltransferase involved in cell wall biosynthesis